MGPKPFIRKEAGECCALKHQVNGEGRECRRPLWAVDNDRAESIEDGAIFHPGGPIVAIGTVQEALSNVVIQPFV